MYTIVLKPGEISFICGLDEFWMKENPLRYSIAGYDAKKAQKGNNIPICLNNSVKFRRNSVERKSAEHTTTSNALCSLCQIYMIAENCTPVIHMYTLVLLEI